MMQSEQEEKMSDIQIKVVPETLISISADVTQKIDRVRAAFAELEHIIQNTSSYWEGDGHSECVEVYQLRKENYENIFQTFKEHIASLQEIAGVYQQAEAVAEDLSKDLEGDVIF